MSNFNGLNMGLGNLSKLSRAKSRSISAENFTGEKGRGGMATEGASKDCGAWLGGQGWKVSPCVKIGAGETFVMADIQDMGAVQQIWITLTGNWRFSIIRIYYDGQENPSVECPAGDFFAAGWGGYTQLSSIPICINPGSAFNCYWEMPFRKRFTMTLTNTDKTDVVLFYQINYTLTEVPEEAAYFHAQFRRVNPLRFKEDYTLLDGVKGQGHYVGTYLLWGVNNNGWWGEGEIKFFMDGDKDFPTICGTGTEDYFCGSYDFENQKTHEYQEFCTPYSGLHQVQRPNGVYEANTRFALYRWHIMDPIRFETDLRVTIQALGWCSQGYLPLQDDIASVAYWYQTLPTAPFPPLPEKHVLEIN